MHSPLPLPRSEPELLARADRVAGCALADLAAELRVPVPPNLKRHKGWIGELIEAVLGVPGGGQAGPDLPGLGIEIKSIPVDARGRPRESTWVCVAPMTPEGLVPWPESPVRHKLARVLWMPVLGEGAPGERWLGAPLLWSPSANEEELLAEDWYALTSLLAGGRVQDWSAHHGQVLQLRPKALSSRQWVWVTDAEGEWVRTVPLGFYLRPAFTAQILAREPRLLDP